MNSEYTNSMFEWMNDVNQWSEFIPDDDDDHEDDDSLEEPEYMEEEEEWEVEDLEFMDITTDLLLLQQQHKEPLTENHPTIIIPPEIPPQSLLQNMDLFQPHNLHTFIFPIANLPSFSFLQK